MFEKSHVQILEECERLGESEVRARLERVGHESFSYNESASAREWLRLREDARRMADALASATVAKASADAASRAASAAEAQARWAKWSAAIAATMAAASNRNEIVELIGHLLG